MRLPGILTPHTVTVRLITGEGAHGPVHGEPTVLRRVRVEATSRLVRGRDGAETVSTARLFTRPEHGPVPPGSLVLLEAGTPLERWATVIAASHEFTPPAPEHYDHSLT